MDDRRACTEYYGDAYARIYLGYRELDRQNLSPELVRERDTFDYVKEKVTLNNEDAVLDIGTFDGEKLALLVDATSQIGIGIDLTMPALYVASKSYPRLSFLRADAQRLPFKSESFDVVTAFDVIEHLSYPELLVSEIRRVLKPSGTVAVTTPNKHNLAWLFSGVIHRIFRLVGEETLIRLLKAQVSLEKRKEYQEIWAEHAALQRNFPALEEHCSVLSSSKLKELLKKNGFNSIRVGRKGLPTIFPGRLCECSARFARLQKIAQVVFGNLPHCGIGLIVIASKGM